MPGISAIVGSGIQDIDALLAGHKWAVLNFTYSFPTSGAFYGTTYGSRENLNNFEALNSAQQTAARSVLQKYSSVANLTFTEITETANVHADLRFAESDYAGTAWGYYPSSRAEGGDSWYNNSGNYYDVPQQGNYAFHTFLHEIGHTLGLKHAHETNVFGAISGHHDSMEYSVMTYHSHPGSALTGYTNEAWGYAQTPMMFDIAALQYLYGANYAYNGGDTRYSWNAATGEMSINGVVQGAPGGNRIFMTMWDGGGSDTYDFSNYLTGVSADIRPGEWTTTSSTQLASLGGGFRAEGNIANALLNNGDLRSIIENVTGGAANDIVTGNQVANVLRGMGGNDTLFGNEGADTLDGGDGNDEIYGGLGDDRLLGSGGFDVLDGGVGVDTSDFSGLGYAVWMDLTYAGVEAWTMDLPTLSGGTWRQIGDLANVENLVGTTHNDFLGGDGGTNVLGYTGGRDVMNGGAGTDVADFSRFGSAVWVSLTYAGVEAWTMDRPTLSGGTWREIGVLRNIEDLVGTSGNDYLSGDGGANVLGYTGGRDFMDGGAGADTADFSRFGSAVWVSLTYPGAEAWTMDLPTLSGGTWREIADLANVENLVGTSATDFLRGNDTVNHVTAGAGNDVIASSAGADWVAGGEGSDRFDYDALDGPADTISDFTGGIGADVLDMRDVLIGYNPSTSNINNFVQLTGSGGDTIVKVNADGIGGDYSALAVLSGVSYTSTLLNDLLANGNVSVA